MQERNLTVVDKSDKINDYRKHLNEFSVIGWFQSQEFLVFFLFATDFWTPDNDLQKVILSSKIRSKTINDWTFKFSHNNFRAAYQRLTQ